MTQKKDKAVTLRDRAEDVYDNAREKASVSYRSFSSPLLILGPVNCQTTF